MNFLQRHMFSLTMGIIFMCLFIFFTEAHPIVVFDGDDWAYLSMKRNPYPIWKDWNPIRVLPEVLLPTIGYVAAYIIYPLYGDYVSSITLSMAFFVSAFAAGMCGAFMMFCHKIFKLDKYQAALCGVLFIAMHFLFLSSKSADNRYLLWSANLTCYGYYVIPDLLNAGLVLCFLRWQNIEEHFNALSEARKGWLLVALYFAIFSNLFNNAILGVFCLSVLGLYLWQTSGSLKERFKACCLEKRLVMGITMAWFVSLAMEAFGGRAGSVGTHPLFILDSLKTVYKFYTQTGKFMLALIAIAIICAVIAYWRSRKERVPFVSAEEKKTFILCAVSLVLFLAYTALLCSKAGAGYAGRPDVEYGAYFFLMCMCFACLSVTVRHIKIARLALPLLVVVIVLMSLSVKHTFVNSTVGNVPPAYAADVSRNLVEQIQSAERAGEKEMTLIVPKGDDRDNWPQPNYMGNNISRTLYAHGLIHRQMKIKIQPDPEMNREFYHR